MWSHPSSRTITREAKRCGCLGEVGSPESRRRVPAEIDWNGPRINAAGTFVRGGIAFGDHYMDEDIVFGNALVETVALDKGGGPPRLALAPSAVEKVRHHLGFYADVRGAPHYRDLLQDADGTVFLNYLDNAFMAIPDDGIFFEMIEKHRNTIKAGLSRYAGTAWCPRQVRMGREVPQLRLLGLCRQASPARLRRTKRRTVGARGAGSTAPQGLLG